MSNEIEQSDTEEISKENQREKKILVLAVGGGGGRVTTDLLKGSSHFRRLVNSIYFLNTNKRDLDEIFNEDLKKLDGSLINIIRYGKEKNLSQSDLISVREWWYGHTGAGGNFVRSQSMMLYWLFREEYDEEKFKELTADQIGKQEEKKEELFIENDSFKSEIEDIMENMKSEIAESDMILLIHSLGGGTGGGGTPVLARYINEKVESTYFKDRILVSLCFLADLHEEALTKANSIRNLMEISKNVNFIFLFSNENLIRYVKEQPNENNLKKQRKAQFRRLNSQIVNAVEILMTAMSEDRITKQLDFHDLNTFSLGLPTNIIIPFLAPEHLRGMLKVPCLDKALNFSLVPPCNGSIVKALPILISSKSGIQNIDTHPKQMYEEIMSKKLRVDMKGYVGDVRGILYDDGDDKLKVLVLGFGLADLYPYLEFLEDAQYQWRAFFEEAEKDNPDHSTKSIIEEIQEWYNQFNMNIESFLKDRKEGYHEN